MPAIVPFGERPLAAGQRASVSEALAQSRTRRELARLESETITRIARTQSTGIVQAEKVHELDNLSREAMTGQALLARHRDAISGGDVILNDELRYFSDLARVGKGEVIADTIAAFCRESRGLR